MAENGKYIYGILNSSADLRLTIPRAYLSDGGDFPAFAYTIPHRGLSALVRDWSGAVALPRSQEALARLLIGHQAVIEKIMIQGAAVVPMKLGTVVRDEGEVRAILQEGYLLMKEILEKVAEKVEIDVVATWSHFDAALKDAGEDPEIRAFKERLLGQPGGAAAEDRMKIGLMVKKALDVRRAGVSREILDGLQAVGVDMRVHELRDDQMVVNAAFLIDRTGQEEFQAKVEALDAALGERLNFKCVGPLPPYSFYTLEAKKFRFEEIDWARRRLGLLEERATRGDIKKAHRAMAFSSHPDRKSGAAGGEDEFAEITRAYHVVQEFCRRDSCSFREAEFPRNALLVKVFGPSN